MNLTDNLLTIGMVAVLLTAGIAATQAAVPGATTQQDGPDSESPDDGGLTVDHVRVDSPSPMAFGLATLAASDVVLAEDESEVLREFHERVLEEIEGDGDRAVES